MTPQPTTATSTPQSVSKEQHHGWGQANASVVCQPHITLHAALIAGFLTINGISAADNTPADSQNPAPIAVPQGNAGTKPSPAAISLCNGKDLTGWDGDPRLWSVTDGCITGKTTKEVPITNNTFLIWKGAVTDFELTCKIKFTISPDNNFGNSGIQFRSVVVDPAKWIVGGLQADMATQPSIVGTLYDERGVGRCAQLGQKLHFKDVDGAMKVEHTGEIGKKADMLAVIKPTEWSDFKLSANGPLIRIWVNGVQTVEVLNESAKGPNGTTLALQLHQGAPMMIQFKDLQLTPLK